MNGSVKQLFLSILLSVLLLGCSSSDVQEGLRGRVVKVTDGDTIVLLQNNHEHRIRLSGVDCPEKKQAFGTVAKQFTAELVFNREVRVVSEGEDRYQRILGWVYLPDGTCLNHELLKAGLAWHYKEYNSDPALAMLEDQARAVQQGLWSERNPVPPWEFRSRRRNQER